ncbi:MAG: SprT-like domain-containing protein [Marinilabiliales bacterium]
MQKHSFDILSNYLPEKAVEDICLLLSKANIKLNIAKSRNSKKGDFKVIDGRFPVITINHDLNKYDFLITLIHELAHYQTWEKYKFKIEPHGYEWRMNFKKLLLVFNDKNVFPENLFKVLNENIFTPRDFTGNYKKKLNMVLQTYNDDYCESLFVKDLTTNTCFELKSGRKFRLIKKIKTRYQCIDLQNKKEYIVSGEAIVKNVLNGFPQ